MLEGRDGFNREESFVELMELCRETSDHKAVLEVFESMKRKGVEPGAQVYKTIMNSIYENSFRVDHTNSLSVGEKQQKRRDELFKLYLVFQEMKIGGVQVDTAVYNTLINACAGSIESYY